MQLGAVTGGRGHWWEGSLVGAVTGGSGHWWEGSLVGGVTDSNHLIS